MTVFTTEVPFSQYTGTGDRRYYEYGWDWQGEEVFVEVDGVPVRFTYQANGVVLDFAPAVGAGVTIYRRTSITQERSWTAFDSFDGAWTEAALDKLILLKQEAIDFRKDANLVANQQLAFTDIVNSKGTNATIYIWNEDMSGVFSGEVTPAPPAIGTVVDKPEDFVYFFYGDVPVLTEVLTSTLYPIETVEKLAITCDLNNASMDAIPEDQVTLIDAELVSIIKIQTLLTAPTQEDEVTQIDAELVSLVKVQTLLIAPTQEDQITQIDTALISLVKEKKLVTAYAPAEKLAITCDLNAASMTPV